MIDLTLAELRIAYSALAIRLANIPQDQRTYFADEEALLAKLIAHEDFILRANDNIGREVAR